MRKKAPYSLLFLVSIGVSIGLSAGCGSGADGGEAGAAAPIPAPENVAAPPADAQRSASGLAWTVLTPGTGTRHPRPNSDVTVHYTGWTTKGEMFESSVLRGEPASFPLDGVIRGWTEGAQTLVEGEKRRFWLPGNLAYVTSSRPGAPTGMLVFDIELIRIGS
jgi:peptidylprolyl isomerase